MPVVLLPVHFDRDPQERPPVPSCQRSVVIRTFITSDFMTGIPATPGQQLSFKVSQIVEQLPLNVVGQAAALEGKLSVFLSPLLLT